jgi:hypothetical protein
MGISLYIYAAIAIVILVLLVMLLRNIRFLFKPSPEQVAEKRIEARKEWFSKWRKKPSQDVVKP